MNNKYFKEFVKYDKHLKKELKSLYEKKKLYEEKNKKTNDDINTKIITINDQIETI